MNKQILILVIGFVLLWNSGFIGAEYGLPHTGPFTLVFWRYLVLSLLIFVYLLVRNRLKWFGWKVTSLNMLIGFLAHGVWLTCVLFALDREVPAGIVALIVALQPLATGALSPSVTHEKTNFYQWIGLVLGFIGVVLSVGFRIDFRSSSSLFGYIIPLFSVMGITVATLIQRKMELNASSQKLPIAQSLFYQGIATMLALAFPAIFIENLQTEWVPEFFYAMSWLILAVSLGAYILMWKLIERLDTTKVASLFYLGPPVTMFMAWIAFGDQIKTMDLVGMGVVSIGVFLTQFRK
ncbi:DMT family transporter [Christiangramia echinicola]|uniref:DMT family transporter n=1 Tax=Christiangramia echinicola TaxID=279359 RepID=UPI00047964ED|nr:DMT family transporter [Christiangramia echinicola]